MKRLIRYSETPQVTGLEYKELFSFRKEKSPAVRAFTRMLVKIVLQMTRKLILKV